MSAERPDLNRRVLLLAPTARDGEATRGLLASASIDCFVCDTLEQVCAEAVAGAGAIMIPEEVVLSDESDVLAAQLRQQPVWSDVPIILLSRSGAESHAVEKALATLGNVTLIERPTRVSTLLSAVRAAVRARERQYQVRDHLDERRLIAEERAQLLEAERRARAEAERASHMKDEFLATLSHELRTPLNAILGWSQILASGSRDADDLAEGLQTIERNARAQTQIIEDLLDMSRIISGKVRLDVQRIDLAPIVHGAVESIKPAAEAKGISLQAVLDPMAGPVSGDPNRLQQVMWNLLTNAVKFTPKGGRVQVVVERVNSHLEVSVSDTGEGISCEFLPHVFDRFRQANSSTTRRHSGLGLGLSIVNQLVELHGGTVRANSPGVGQGSTFTVALPLAVLNEDDEVTASPHRIRPGGATSPQDQRCEVVRLSGVTVLVVEDEPDARELVRRFLTSCEAHVLTAASAKEGLAALTEHAPDVIISDIGMPDVDGYELMRRIRSHPDESRRRIPAIALTAFARSEDRTRAMLAGYNVHLSKPVEPVELAATVASLIGRTGADAQ